jgi:hypothetical protein
MSQRRLCSLLAFAVLATCALQPNAAVQVAQRSSGDGAASAAVAAAHVHTATAGGRHVRSMVPGSPSLLTATRAAGDPQDRRRLLAGATPPPLSPPSQGAPALAAQQLYGDQAPTGVEAPQYPMDPYRHSLHGSLLSVTAGSRTMLAEPHLTWRPLLTRLYYCLQRLRRASRQRRS